MRFIHMADVHLGAVPDSGCPWSAYREKEIWETFERVIDQIREEKIELLLIAGDLFHRQPLPSQTEKVRELFASIPDTEVVWMAGSHDYLREDSSWRTEKWTDNVHGFLSGKPEVIELKRLHTYVHGCSYERPEITEPVYSTIQPDERPGIHILLAYGGDETHIPMKKEDGAGYDYVAMGYRHMPGVLVENQMAYAGSPEPLCLEEGGVHGVVYGEIAEDEQGTYHTQITLVPCACRSYIPLALRIHSGTTQAGLEQKVRDAINQKGKEEIYWLRIQGYRNPELDFQLDALKTYGNIVKVTDETRPCYDLARLKREKLGTPVGTYIYRFEKRQGRVEQKALDYGLQALLDEHENPGEILTEKMTLWQEKKQELERQRESRQEKLEQKVHHVMRERSGLEQQILVNRSEIRRLELNRSTEEKHLEQERREEGKRQAESGRMVSQMQNPQKDDRKEKSLQAEDRPQQKRDRNQTGKTIRPMHETTNDTKIPDIVTVIGIVLAVILLVNPLSWNLIVSVILAAGIIFLSLTGRKYLAAIHPGHLSGGSVLCGRNRTNTALKNTTEQKAEIQQQEEETDWENDWEIRLQRMKRELRQIDQQIHHLQERGEQLATELKEKRILTENLQEEIREMTVPMDEEETCETEISSLKLALTVLLEEGVLERV